MLGALTVVGFLVLAGAYLTIRVITTLPSVNTVGQESTRSVIYDLAGQPVSYLWGQAAQPVPLSEIPIDLQDAIIATEDHAFYQNSGIDLKSIVRAALADLTHRAAVQGASTITEQLAKIHYLSNQKTLTRKIAEVILGLEIAHTYTKAQILDMYLNQVYLGEGATGVADASQVYFNKPVSQLTLGQAALIAGLPQAPSYLDPFVNLTAAVARQHVVLQNMVHYGYITEAQAQAAASAPLDLSHGTLASTTNYPYPWYVDTVVSTLLSHGFSMNQLLYGGLKIYTPLVPSIENDATNAVATVMNKAFGPIQPGVVPNNEAAVIVIDPHNGYVEAVVGGRVHNTILAFNRATQAYRQTGSAIKPLAEYTTAILQGYTPGTIIDDGIWMFHNGVPWPQNDSKRYLGRITMQRALSLSDNNASVRLLSMVGIHNAFVTATQIFGLPLVAQGVRNDQTLAMGIGGLTKGVTPMQMAEAYTVFPNEGYRAIPIVVTKVVSPTGQVLFTDAPQLIHVLSAQVSYVMIKMMERMFVYGTARSPLLQINRPAAGKTGTTNRATDGWFIAFTPQLETVVWEGTDNNATQPGVYGATHAGPIWADLMRQVVANMPVEHFPRPPGIVQVTIDTKSGMLPSPLTPRQYNPVWLGYVVSNHYFYINGTQPTQQSNVWIQVQVDSADTSLLWTPGCPSPPVTKVFLTRPTDIMTGPGMQLPIDSVLWPPTQSCTSGTTPPASTPSSATVFIQNGAATPTAISTTVGTTFSLTLQNADNVPYTFTLPAFGVGTQTVGANTSLTMTMNANQAGTYGWTLSPTNGATPTINGTLTVEPAASSSTPPSGGSSSSPSSGSPSSGGSSTSPSSGSPP